MTSSPSPSAADPVDDGVTPEGSAPVNPATGIAGADGSAARAGVVDADAEVAETADGVDDDDAESSEDDVEALGEAPGRGAVRAVPVAPPVPDETSVGVAAGTGARAARGRAQEDAAAGSGTRVSRLEEEGEVAADYLEELLDIVDLDGDIDIDVADARAVVSIVGEDDEGGAALRTLAGPHGEVLEALQELTRLAVQTRTGERSRLMLDVAGYRAERREQLLVIAGEAISLVESEGGPVALDPMNPFERKVVHDAVAAAGLVSDSDGVEPQRHVVVHPRQG